MDAIVLGGTVAIIILVAIVAGVLSKWFDYRGRAAARQLCATLSLACWASLAALVLAAVAGAVLNVSATATCELTLGIFVASVLTIEVGFLGTVSGSFVWPRMLRWHQLGLQRVSDARMLLRGLLIGLAVFALTSLLAVVWALVGLEWRLLGPLDFVRSPDPTSLIVVLVASAAVVPVVEELFFRGFLFGMCRTGQPRWMAFSIPSLLFAVFHLLGQNACFSASQLILNAIQLIGVGLLLTWLYDRMGSLYPGILAHAANNLVAIVVFYFFGFG